GMAHEVEGAVHAGITRAQQLVLRQVSKGVAGCMGMTQEKKLDALLAVVQHELVVEHHVGNLERAAGDVLASGRSTPGLGKLLGAVNPEQASTVSLGDDTGAGLAEDRIAVGVVAMVMG